MKHVNFLKQNLQVLLADETQFVPKCLKQLPVLFAKELIGKRKKE